MSSPKMSYLLFKMKLQGRVKITVSTAGFSDYPRIFKRLLYAAIGNEIVPIQLA